MDDCIISPLTGRAVKKDSPAGRRALKYNTKNNLEPSNDCVINPLTGRAVKKDGALGKKILKGLITAPAPKPAPKPYTMYKKPIGPVKPPPKPYTMYKKPIGPIKPKKKEDTNRLHNLPDDIQKQIMKEVYKDGWDFPSVYGKLKASPKEFSKAVGIGNWDYDSFADYMKKPERKKLIEAMEDSIKKNDGLLGYEWTEKDILKGKKDDESQEAIKLINKEINKDIRYSQKIQKQHGAWYHRDTPQQIRNNVYANKYVVIRFPNGYLLVVSASKVDWDLKQFTWGNSIKDKNKIIKYKKYEYRDDD